MRKKLSALVALFVVAGVLLPTAAFAATNTSLSQVINPGTLTIDIVDGSGVSVVSPAVAFPTTTFSFSCQTQTATFGTASQKVKVSNPVLSGVKVDINAQTPASDNWTNGSETYSYKDAAGSGCTNGQMSITGGTFTQTAGANAPTYTLPGGAFSSTSPVTLMNNTSTTAWEGELTGYTLSQKIPAEQADGSYSLTMVVSAIAQ